MGKDIKIVGITLTYNEEKMIPYVMPYYERLKIDKLVVYDNFSTDGTVKELRKYPFVEVREFQSDGFNDQVHINIKNEVWKQFKGTYDWCICCDFDEVLYCDGDIRKILAAKESEGKTVFRQTMLNLYGYNEPSAIGIVHESFDRGCLWKDFSTNICWGMKSTLFNLKAITETNYTFGCHNDSFVGDVRVFNEDIYAFHLKYINFEETLRRNIVKRERLSDFNKENNLSIEDQIIERSALDKSYKQMESNSISIKDFIDSHTSKYHFCFEKYGIDRYFHKDVEDRDRYLVCACAKNENKYIVEWVEHYLSYGFDKIIICDNNDDNSLETILSEYIQNKTVELFDCRGLNSFQVQFYSYFAEEGNYKWCAFFDIDEFLELQDCPNIKKYLSKKNEEDCISFNWLIYGSNGKLHYEDKRVQERFKYPFFPISEIKENCFVKSILRGGKGRFTNCLFNGSHIPTCSNQDNLVYSVGGYFRAEYVLHEYLPPRYKEGYIKHYCTKSFDEWIRKSNRGWPDGTDNLPSGNYFVTDGNYGLPLDKYYEGFFVYTAADDIYKGFRDILSSYEIIQVYNTNHCVYTLIVKLSAIMKNVTGYTFVVCGEHINDSLFNTLFEIGKKTGNNIVYSHDGENIDEIFKKYTTGKSNFYYIIDL